MKSVICAIVKNEQLFIREWVEHNLNIGFDKLYIYEDFGSNSHYNEISDYINKGKVELTSLDDNPVVKHFTKGTAVQGSLYKYFFRKCKNEHIADWCGFFDVDEFLMFEKDWTLNRLETEFADKGGVLLSWKNYGANGHISRPKGDVVKNYTTPMPDGTRIDRCSKEWNVKSLVNVQLCNGNRSIHVFNNCCFTDGKTYIKGDMVYCKAWINHYFSKSFEDYCVRMFNRGNMQNNFRSFDNFFIVNPELYPRREELMESVRYKHCASTMWISRELRILSGGNLEKLKDIEKMFVARKSLR